MTPEPRVEDLSEDIVDEEFDEILDLSDECPCCASDEEEDE